VSLPSTPWAGADVTVTLCAYNEADVIHTALASIAGQTVMPASVVVVDDGSTDTTSSVIAEWSDLLPIALVRLDDNVGIGAARSVAVAQVATDLVALLDADDAWLPDHLETLLALYAQTPGLVYSRSLVWVPGSDVGPESEPARALPTEGDQPRVIVARNFLHICTLFAKADHDRAGGFRATLPEDWDLWIRMIRAGVRVSRTNHPTALYRIRPSSLSFADDVPEQLVDMMEQVLEEAATDQERDWARESLERLQAGAALARAFHHAADGDIEQARRDARHALHGDAHTRRRAAIMMLAPRLGSRERQRRMSDLSRWIDR
jgi:glycosyltransferase involved in cell wall biosynthesis